MYEFLYSPPMYSDEHYLLARWMPLPDGKSQDKQSKYSIMEVAEGIKSFFETHLERQVNVSIIGEPEGYILVSVGHFAFVISQLLKGISDLECPHLNIEITEKFRIIITFNFEMPIPKNIVDIAITAEHAGFPMHMEGENLVFEARLRKPRIMTLYQSKLCGFLDEFERAMLWELNRK